MADIFKKKYGSDKSGTVKETVTIPYSKEYEEFKKSEISQGHRFYEGLCHIASKVIKPKLGKGKKEKLSNAIRLTHLDIEPESVYSLAYIGLVLSLLVGAAFVFFFLSLTTIIAVLVIAPTIFYLLKKIPFRMLKRWRAKASNQLVSAVLYMIVDIKRGSNLERAIHFTANQVPPPLSLDFMRLLWEFQTGKFSTVKEALDNYTIKWKGVEDGFVDSVQLVVSSLRQSSKKAQRTLDKATDVILQSVQDNMRHFAHDLSGPVKALHMLGIVLPVLLLVMLPLVASFLKIPWYYLVLVFDVVLPISIYALAKRILSMRPGGISNENLETHMKAKQGKYKFWGVLAAVGVFLLFCAGAFLYFVYERGRGAEFVLHSDPLFYLSMIGTAAIGFTILTYLWVSGHKALRFKRKISRLEEGFSSAAFQLGSRIDEGTPPELAFAKVARDTKGTPISKFFKIVDYNLRVKNMSLKDAIFHKGNGAIVYFPSPTIRSVMKLLVEGAKKSLKAAASALLVISRYLRDKHRVYERMKDLLADTISSMKMQASFFVSVIIAIVAGLATMIVRIMSALSGVLRGGMSESIAGGGTGGVTVAEGYEGIQNISMLFNADNAVAAYQFQLIVGVYLILVVLLLSYVLALVLYGGDKIEMKYIMAKNLFKAIVIYSVGLVLLHMLLGSITSGIVQNMVAT